MRKALCLFACLAAAAIPATAQIVATPPIGGFTLPAGGCFTQPVTYGGAAVGSTLFTVNPETFAGNGIWWQAYVSAPNQVTVKVCAGIAGYVNAAVYDVEVASSGAGFVTSVSATAPITSSGGVTPNISATYQGTGLKIQASTGSTTSNDCVKFDATGNTVDAGAACAAGTVTAVSATAPLTSSGGATPNISAAYQGNGLKVQASTGATTSNDCVKFDAAGNTIDAGAGCGTVTSVTATGPITSSGGATPNISATYQGTGSQIQASTGATTPNDCVKFDATGNTVDAGGPCAVGTVTSVSATAPLTSSGGATPTISAAYQGNGLKVQASTGSTTTNDCVKFDVNGNTVDAGAACGGAQQFALSGTPACSGGAVCTTSTGSALVTTAGTTITFSSISGGNNLQMEICGRASNAAIQTNVITGLNGDVAANYNFQNLTGAAAVPSAFGANGTTPQSGTIAGNTATVNRPGCYTMKVLNYSGVTFQKIITASGTWDSGVSGLQVQDVGLVWTANTGNVPVTSVTLTLNTGANWQVGSTVTAYTY